MLNLNDLNTNHGSNFFDVSGIKLKRVPDEDDEDDALSLRPRTFQDSVGSRSITSPWEFDFSSTASSKIQQPQPEFMSSFAFSEGGGILIGADRPFHKTPDTSFAILGDANPLSSMDSGITYRPAYKHSAIGKSVFYAGIACSISLCLAAHIVGLLVYFTPWYNESIQIFIFRRFYSSFSIPAFEGDIDAKRSAVAFVYLLFVGLLPTAVAASLWFTFSSSKDLRSLCEAPQLLRRKPVLMSTWRPIYVDATYGEVLLLILTLFSNACIFILSLLKNKTETSSPSEKIWRDVGRAFGFDATFNLVWLVLTAETPSAWIVYLDILGVTSPHTTRKYRRWFGVLVVTTSILHAVCMIIHFRFAGSLSSQLFPRWSSISSNPSMGVSVFGEIALGALLIAAVSVMLDRRVSPAITSVAKSMGCGVFVVAFGVHYPGSIAWILPSLVMVLIHKAVVWTHSRRQVKLVDMAPLPNRITRLVVQADTKTSEFVPGQAVYINIPQVSWTQWLCCSVTSSPRRNPGVLVFYVHSPLELSRTSTTDAKLVQGVHDTAKVAYAMKEQPVVYIDGFYGTSHRLHFEKYSCLVFIANDMGVVQVMGMLEELYQEAWEAASAPLDRKVMREFGIELEEIDTPPEKNGIRAFGRQVWLLWTSKDVCLFKEFEDLFFRIKALDPLEVHFKLSFFLTEIPVHEDLKYQRLPSASFLSDDAAVKRETRGLPIDARQANDVKRPVKRRGLTCWSSRPFHQALSHPLVKTLTLWLVIGVAVPVSILVEWFALRTQTSGEFPPIRLCRNVILVVLACVGTATVVAILADCVTKCQRDIDAQSSEYIAEQPRERLPPTRGLQKLRSMTKMVDDIASDDRGDVESAESFRDTAGPDVIERLMVFSMRPDIDKFLQTVGRSFPSFAGTIGVFASGNDSLVKQVEVSVLSSATRADDWSEVKAVFDLHCMQ